MTWFDRKICTLEEARFQSASRDPGFLQRGDLAKLWIDTPDPAVPYRAFECYVVGVKLGFEGKLFYDVAIPIADSGYCTVLHEIYGYLTPPHVLVFDPERYTAKDITGCEPQMRRVFMRMVSAQEMPESVAPRAPGAQVVRLLQDKKQEA